MATINKKQTMVVAAMVISAVALEAASWVGLWLLGRVRDVRYDPNPTTLTTQQRKSVTRFIATGRGERAKHDPDLGWLPSDTNSAGMRDTREYTPDAPAGIVRIATFGDSFTFCEDVKTAECWAQQMMAANSSVEVFNYGVGAYGTDQAWLRYQRLGRQLKPRIVLIGYMSENLARTVNVFRMFYTNQYRNTIFTKPRFRLRGGELELLPNPLARREDYQRLLANEPAVLAELGRNDFHYQERYNGGPLDWLRLARIGKLAWHYTGRRWTTPTIFTYDGSYNPQSEAYSLGLQIISRFYRNVLEDGALPVIVVFPDINDQMRSRAGKPRRYQSYLDEFRARQYRLIDLMELVKTLEPRQTIDDLTREFGHFSPLMNQLTGKEILDRLQRGGLLTPEGAAKAAADERNRLAVTLKQ